MYRPYGLALVVFLVVSCHFSDRNSQKYRNQIKSWQQDRINSLKQDDSWLSLAGLYWLEKGQNRFGSDSSNAIVFPKDNAPGIMGSFILQDSTVHVSIRPDVAVEHNNKAVSEMKMETGASGEPTILTSGSLSWYIIKRGNRLGVRLKDANKEDLKNFKGLDYFPIDKKWRIRAKYVTYDSARTVDVPTITGEPAERVVPGKLIFEIKGTNYELIPTLGNMDEEKLFVVFGDRTNGETTYGGGRFVYVERPTDGNTTYIDFNKAYNPPCVFTPYATCPLPLPENKLQTAIKAGEKNFGEHW